MGKSSAPTTDKHLPGRPTSRGVGHPKDLPEKTSENLPDLQIAEGLLKKILEHAQREYPLECCGILAGREGKITRVYSAKNVEKNSSSYLMDPQEQFEIFRQMEEEGLKMLAIFHSHPHSPAYPSPRDVGHAFYPDSQIWIVSLMDPKAPQIRAFQIDGGKVRKKAIKVYPKN